MPDRNRFSLLAVCPSFSRRWLCRSWPLVVGLGALAGAADDPERAPIRESPVLAAPFEAEPFRPVRVPNWVEETMGSGYTLSVLDSEARRRAVDAGVTISEMGFVDPFYAYYDSALLKRRSPHVPLERLEKDIAEYDRLGLRILGVYPPTLQGEVYEAHPDWRRIATNTAEIPQVDMVKLPHGGMLCLLGPYGDFFIEVLAEISTRFPSVDAFSFDGLHHGGVCYCQHCRAAFRRDLGAEIPNTDLRDPLFRRYQHWADRRLESLIQRLQARLKSIRPDIALVTWTTNAGRFGHFLSVPRNMPSRMNLLLDAPDQELWLDETNRGASIVPALGAAYIWATTNHRVAFSEPYLMSHGNPYGKDSFPAHEVLRRMLLCLTWGARPSIAVAQPGVLQAAVYEGLREVGRRKPWIVGARPEPWAALLLSDDTRTFYGREAGRVEERYLANVFGAFRAALEEHLPLTVINDWNLTREDLAPYRVLILPNAACLAEAQVAAVREHVRSGGGLVASVDTSLFDEHGDPRRDFGLADVLGVGYRGTPVSEPAPAAREVDVNFEKSIGPDYWERRRGTFQLRFDASSPLAHGRLGQYVGADSVTFKGQAVRIAVTDEQARVLATMRPHDRPEAPEIPAIVTRGFGKGRVVFLAAGLDAAYYLYPYPYQRVAWAGLVEWAAAAPPPVRVEAPMCVHATLTRQKLPASERLVLQLFNDVNTTAFHGLQTDDVPLREETIPIRDVRVTFRGVRLAQVRLEPQGLELERRESPDGVQVTVPELTVHAIVAATLAP